MIIELAMAPLWFLIDFLIGLIPDSISTVSSGFNSILDIIGYGCAFIGTNFFLGVIGNIVFWMTAQLGWAIIEWCYKKIPGVN